MALVSTVLAGGLTQVFGQPSDNAAQKASEFASAYQSYAAAAMAGVLVPVFTGSEQPSFMGALLPAFQNPQTTPNQFANAIADAVERFWFLPPVPFTGPAVAGAVTGVPGKGAMVGALLGVLAASYPDAATPAQAIATAIDTGTRTVIVTFAPPPGSTAPLV